MWPLDSDRNYLRNFIRRALPSLDVVNGPLAIGAIYDGALTVAQRCASLRTIERIRKWCKLNLFPLLRGSPSAHNLVFRCSPNAVSKALALESVEEGSLVLLATFDGAAVANLKALAPLTELARTLGRVRLECARESRCEVGLQTIELSDFPGVFRDFIENVESNFDVWREEDWKRQCAMCDGLSWR